MRAFKTFSACDLFSSNRDYGKPKPEGRRTRMCAVFRPSHDGESENSQKMSCRFSSVGEEPFFGYFLDSRRRRSPLRGRLRRSRCAQWLRKESNSPKAALNGEAGQALLSNEFDESIKTIDAERFDRFAAEFISFAGTKETNQRKCLPRQTNQGVLLPSGFSDSPIHGSVGKRRTSMCAALRVYNESRRFNLKSNS